LSLAKLPTNENEEKRTNTSLELKMHIRTHTNHFQV